MSAHSDRRRRFSGANARFGILAAILLVVAAIWFWRSVVRVHGFIVSLAPIDATRAVVCVRANHEYGFAARAWIAVIDSKGDYAWSRRLPGLPTVAVHEGLLVEDGVAYVRTLDDDERGGSTTALRVSDGSVLWTKRFSPARGSFALDLLGYGPNLVQGIDEGDGWKAVSMAKATGEVQWEQHFGDRSVGMRALGSKLLVEDPGGAVQLSSTPAFEIARGEGCIVDGEYVILAPPDATHPARILARRFDGGAARTVAEPVPWADGTVDRSIACATHAGRVLFFVTSTKFGEAKPSEGLALVDADAKGGGAATRTLLTSDRETVGSIAAGGSSLVGYRQYGALRGALPRFVPLAVYQEAKVHLNVVDLEERRLRPRGPALEHGMTIFHVGDTFVLQPRAGSGEVALFDGVTGTMTAAVETALHGASVKPYHLRDGHLWMHGTDWVSPLPFAVLDAKTLAKVDARMEVTDVLAATRKAWLGE